MELSPYSYFGCERIAETVSGYLGSKEVDQLKKKDVVNAVFTAMSSPASMIRLPSQAFWGLKDCWWMQIFDGKYHRFGSMVFDKGLHRGAVEPGFYDSAKKACEFLSGHFGKKLTILLYKELHKIACAHFRGKSTSTACDETMGGIFYGAECCGGMLPELFKTLPKSAQQNKFKRLKDSEDIRNSDYMDDINRQAHLKGLGISCEEVETALQSAKDYIEKFYEEVDNRIAKVNGCIAVKSVSLGLSKSLAILKLTTSGVYMAYLCPHGKLERVAQTLFEQFHEGMAKATTNEERIIRIAEFYQLLEWLHPFYDGQGRTDLIVLAWLLCSYGFNPAILEDPYVSTFSPLEDWVDYLKKGIEQWQSRFIVMA